jgi:hypothetical protein
VSRAIFSLHTLHSVVLVFVLPRTSRPLWSGSEHAPPEIVNEALSTCVYTKHADTDGCSTAYRLQAIDLLILNTLIVRVHRCTVKILVGI